MYSSIKTIISKFFQSKFSLLVAVTLVGGLFLSINVALENRDKRSHAYTVATVPGSYGYGGFDSDRYNGTVSSGGTIVPSPTQTIAPTAVPTNIPTPTPTRVSTPTPTRIPTPTPTRIPTPTPTRIPIPTPTSVPTPTPTRIPTSTPASINLAKNRPATAGSTYSSTFVPSKAVDGNANSYWISKSTNRWIKVDLGALKYVSKFVIKHYGGTFSTKNYSIQTSSNNSTWTTVVKVTNNTVSTTTHTISRRSARYIRVNITTPAQNTYPYAIIRELEVY